MNINSGKFSSGKLFVNGTYKQIDTPAMLQSALEHIFSIAREARGDDEAEDEAYELIVETFDEITESPLWPSVELNAEEVGLLDDVTAKNLFVEFATSAATKLVLCERVLGGSNCYDEEDYEAIRHMVELIDAKGVAWCCDPTASRTPKR